MTNWSNGWTTEQLFRNNVSWAKMMLNEAKLAEYREWFAANGLPTERTPVEQAAIELLGL